MIKIIVIILNEKAVNIFDNSPKAQPENYNKKKIRRFFFRYYNN